MDHRFQRSTKIKSRYKGNVDFFIIKITRKRRGSGKAAIIELNWYP